jgi:hypothetical protein
MTGGGGGAGPACAKFTAEATQIPAAMLVVLDMSASMNSAQKWGTSQLAVVSAVDKDVFDSMSLGLLTFPTMNTPGPDCLFGGIIDVSCGVSFLPQVDLAPAGNDKSNAPMGVRKSIRDYLVSHGPLSNIDDGSPVYDALTAAYSAIKAYSIDQRMVLLITDGGFSCTSVSSPLRPGYQDANGCGDWEIPDTVNKHITNARMDPTKPIRTFVVGVPGSNSAGGKDGNFDTPPYSMLLALSTYAVSGSPETVDPACDKGAVYTQMGPPPAVPCHIDLSNGAAFDAEKLAKAISDVRGKALGCVYDLPKPPMGEVIDKAFVNVSVTIEGMTTIIKKRSKADDQCLDEPCWDYNAKDQVEIIGKGCADISAAAEAKVEIQVGCETILK